MGLVFEFFLNPTPNCDVITPSFGQNGPKFSPAQLLVLETEGYTFRTI